jgi:hypothetical protein
VDTEHGFGPDLKASCGGIWNRFRRRHRRFAGAQPALPQAQHAVCKDGDQLAATLVGSEFENVVEWPHEHPGAEDGGSRGQGIAMPVNDPVEAETDDARTATLSAETRKSLFRNSLRVLAQQCLR